MGRYIIGSNRTTVATDQSVDNGETTLEDVDLSINEESDRGLRLMSELLKEQQLTNKLLRKIYNPE